MDRGLEDEGRGESGAEYEPPQIVPLGTLAELTQGGSSGPSDMFGGAGDSGSL